MDKLLKMAKNNQPWLDIRHPKYPKNVTYMTSGESWTLAESNHDPFGSPYADNSYVDMKKNTISLVVNAWDDRSFIGNGGYTDNSLEGWIVSGGSKNFFSDSGDNPKPLGYYYQNIAYLHNPFFIPSILKRTNWRYTEDVSRYRQSSSFILKHVEYDSKIKLTKLETNNLSGLIGQASELKNAVLHPIDFDTQICKLKNGDGNYELSSAIILATYYYRFLTPAIRKTHKLYNGLIRMPTFEEGVVEKDEMELLMTRFQDFLHFVKRSPHDAVCVAMTKIDKHALLISVDKKLNVFRFHDSNGMFARYRTKYTQDLNDKGWLFQFFVDNIEMIRSISELKDINLWFSPSAKQEDKASCGLWSTVRGMFLLSGINNSMKVDEDAMLQLSILIRDTVRNMCIASINKNLNAGNATYDVTRKEIVHQIKNCKIGKDGFVKARQILERYI